MKVRMTKSEWYPVYIPFKSNQKDRNDEWTRYEVPALLWILYVPLYYLFYWVWQAIVDGQND